MHTVFIRLVWPEKASDGATIYNMYIHKTVQASLSLSLSLSLSSVGEEEARASFRPSTKARAPCELANFLYAYSLARLSLYIHGTSGSGGGMAPSACSREIIFSRESH